MHAMSVLSSGLKQTCGDIHQSSKELCDHNQGQASVQSPKRPYFLLPCSCGSRRPRRRPGPRIANERSRVSLILVVGRICGEKRLKVIRSPFKRGLERYVQIGLLVGRFHFCVWNTWRRGFYSTQIRDATLIILSFQSWREKRHDIPSAKPKPTLT